MIRDLFFEFEQKVEQAIELIDLLRLQVDDLERENMTLRAEQDKWKEDLSNLIKKFDNLKTTVAEVTNPAN